MKSALLSLAVVTIGIWTTDAVAQMKPPAVQAPGARPSMTNPGAKPGSLPGQRGNSSGFGGGFGTQFPGYQRSDVRDRGEMPVPAKSPAPQGGSQNAYGNQGLGGGGGYPTNQGRTPHKTKATKSTPQPMPTCVNCKNDAQRNRWDEVYRASLTGGYTPEGAIGKANNAVEIMEEAASKAQTDDVAAAKSVDDDLNRMKDSNANRRLFGGSSDGGTSDKGEGKGIRTHGGPPDAGSSGASEVGEIPFDIWHPIDTSFLRHLKLSE